MVITSNNTGWAFPAYGGITGMTSHYFETPQARGERVYREGSGLGVIIEMHDGTYSMHNGVSWDSSEIVDQYIGIDGIDPRTLTTELLYFIADSREQRIRAEAAEQELDKLLKNIGKAQRVLLEDSGAITFENISKLLDIVLEGSKPDATE